MIRIDSHPSHPSSSSSKNGLKRRRDEALASVDSYLPIPPTVWAALARLADFTGRTPGEVVAELVEKATRSMDAI